MAKIYKSKFYIAKILPDRTRLVLPELGAFATDSKAFGSMFQARPQEEQDDSRFIRMELKPEFEGHTTVKGERILKRPNFWKVADD